MTVRVTASSGEVSNFDNGDKWELVDSPAGPHVNIIKQGNANAQPPTLDKVVGSFAPGHWNSVRQTAKEDKAALLDVAKNLIEDVDDGNFGHQSTDWQNRAEQFLRDMANRA